MLDVVEVLQGGKNYLLEHGWSRDGEVEGKQSRCAHLALGAQFDLDEEMLHKVSGVLCEAVDCLILSLPPEVSRRERDPRDLPILGPVEGTDLVTADLWEFNDFWAEGFNDIMDLYDRAILRAKEEAV